MKSLFFKQNSKLPRALPILLAIFILIGSLVCVSLAKPATDSVCGGMNSHESSLLCSGDMIFHETIVSEALPTLMALFAIAALAFLAVFSLEFLHNKNIVKNLLSLFGLKYKHIAKRKHPDSFNIFTKLFSRGILHPQIYG